MLGKVINMMALIAETAGMDLETSKMDIPKEQFVLISRKNAEFTSEKHLNWAKIVKVPLLAEAYHI